MPLMASPAPRSASRNFAAYVVPLSQSITQSLSSKYFIAQDEAEAGCGGFRPSLPRPCQLRLVLANRQRTRETLPDPRPWVRSPSRHRLRLRLPNSWAVSAVFTAALWPTTRAAVDWTGSRPLRSFHSARARTWASERGCDAMNPERVLSPSHPPRAAPPLSTRDG